MGTAHQQTIDVWPAGGSRPTSFHAVRSPAACGLGGLITGPARALVTSCVLLDVLRRVPVQVRSR